MYQFDRFHGIGDKQKVKIWRSRISRGYDKKKTSQYNGMYHFPNMIMFQV